MDFQAQRRRLALLTAYAWTREAEALVARERGHQRGLRLAAASLLAEIATERAAGAGRPA